MYKIVGLCAIGLEKMLAYELKKIGCSLLKTQKGKIYFEADDEIIAKVHIQSRIAERFLLVLAEFEARNFDDLFDATKAIEWENWIRKQDRLVIEKVRLNRAAITSVPNTQSMIQKAAYNRLCRIYNVNTMGESGEPVHVRFYADGTRCMIGLDLSGDPLHMRGYRKVSGPAPLKETIAAGLLMLSGWKRKYPLHDPFCGTGTIPIEAALFACNRAPGLERDFAFERIHAFSHKACEKARNDARKAIALDYVIRITGSDSDKQMIETSNLNLASAGLPDKASFFHSSMEELKRTEENGFLIANPPYGDRLHDVEWAYNLYRQMRHLKRDYAGWKMGVVTTSPKFSEMFDANPIETHTIHSGSDDLLFTIFQL